jgi:hypothetical protein
VLAWLERAEIWETRARLTIRWADENVDKWLETLNPEVALIMFGSNDVGQMNVEEYTAKDSLCGGPVPEKTGRS